MLKILRTNSLDKNFVKLVELLDAELAERDGDDHAFYNQFNKIDKLNHVIIIYLNELAVGCGAMKQFENESMEIKRMYVLQGKRNQGIASQILLALENWAKELNYKKCILETGKRQPEAIKLYSSRGYKITSNYGQYIGVENSVCFEKILKK